MAKKKQIKASELKGMNIYQDPKHGTILYDWLTKKGFQITSLDAKWVGFSQAFLPVTVVIAYGLNVLVKLPIINSIIIAAIAYVVMKLIYRVKFLNNLTSIDNYKRPDNGNLFEGAAKNYSKTRLILLIVLSLALIAVTVAYLISLKPQGSEKIAFVILLLCAAIMFIFSLVSLIKKKKQN